MTLFAAMGALVASFVAALMLGSFMALLVFLCNLCCIAYRSLFPGQKNAADSDRERLLRKVFNLVGTGIIETLPSSTIFVVKPTFRLSRCRRELRVSFGFKYVGALRQWVSDMSCEQLLGLLADIRKADHSRVDLQARIDRELGRCGT